MPPNQLGNPKNDAEGIQWELGRVDAKHVKELPYKHWEGEPNPSNANPG